MKKVIALLPIKSHSERVSGKNFRPMCGKPLYAWVLETLISCERIDQVIIDTDSESFIQELNEKYPSVRTILRPESIRGDFVSMNRIIAHDIGTCDDDCVFFQTHTTNPLITRDTINGAIEAFAANCGEYDSLFSVNRIQARTYWRDGSPINHTLGELKRTQDLEPVYEENSNFFIFTKQSFSQTDSRIGKNPYLYETPHMESLEIDEEDDFIFVETVMKALIDKAL